MGTVVVAVVVLAVAVAAVAAAVELVPVIEPVVVAAVEMRLTCYSLARHTEMLEGVLVPRMH